MSTEFNMILAKKLKSLRDSVHLTQDDVAALLGMNRTSFSKYENGAATPPLSVLRKLAKLYAIPIEQLIATDPSRCYVFSSEIDPLPDDMDIEQVSAFFSKLSQEERMIILKLRMLSDDNKNEILRQIDDNFEGGE